MKLKTILDAKGNQVFTIPPHASLADVVQSLLEHNCGSLVVCDEDRLVGIITERDILKACASTTEPLAAMRVEDRMTRDVVTGTPADKISDVMGVMTEKRIRHLPVLVDGCLVGMVSIGDVVKAERAHTSMENHYLKSYIQS